MIDNCITFNDTNECRIKALSNGNLQLMLNNERFHFSEENKAIFPGNTGETVIEYIGLTTDANASRSFAKASFAPSGFSPAHYHDYHTEDYYIFSGEAHVMIDGILHVVPSGCHIRIAPGQIHQVINPSDEEQLHLLVICEPAWSADDFHLITNPDETTVFRMTK